MPLPAVDGLVGGGGEDQELVPLVGEQAGHDVVRNVLVEGESTGPLHQLDHNVVADLIELVRQHGDGRVQQKVDVLTERDRYRLK